jgi:Predicted membrane protein (DUF2254)
MNRNGLSFARGVVVVGAVMLVVVAVGLYVDVSQWHYPLGRLDVFDYNEGRFVVDTTNRGLNQLLALVFTVVAIAVPLTANLYSLKFLDFFIKDRINLAVLALVVLTDLASFWVIYSLKETAIPLFQMHVAFGLLITCLCVLFPYLLYVFHFLHPNTLLHRLESEIEAALRAAAQRPARSAAHAKVVSDGLAHIANIAVRYIERTDRDTAIESVLALERVARVYARVKSSLPPGWFVAEPDWFRGFSSKAVDEFIASRTWVEMKLLWQLRGILSAAVPRTHDVADAAAKTLRHFGLEASVGADAALRELVVEYFNTFIRLALSRRDAHTAFSLFDHYRLLAVAWNTAYPDLVLEIAYYFQYYGQLARDNQMPFLVKAGAHDLGSLVQHAWETRAPNRQKLLERFLEYDLKEKSPLPGVIKAQAILASYFMLAGQTEPLALIRQSLVSLDASLLNDIEDDLLHVKREKYWEMSERRMHIDYVPDAQREKLREFFEQLAASAA